MMKSPRFAATHPDYGLECEEALEPYLIAIIEKARRMGWERGEIWQSLHSVTTNLELAEFEDQQTDLAIATARFKAR